MRRVGSIVPYLLPAGAVKVGSTISSLDYPLQRHRFAESVSISPKAGNVLLSVETGVSNSTQHRSQLDTKVVLHKILTLLLSKAKRNDLGIDTKKVLTYEMDNSDDIFEQICADPEYQVWLEKTLKKRDAYFIVGIQTIADAVVILNSESSMSGAGSATLPIPPHGGTIEAGLGAELQQARRVQFTTQNEQIYALQYRKIKFDKLLAKDVDEASLDKAQKWKTHLVTRGNGGDNYTRFSLATDEDRDDSTYRVVVDNADERLMINPIFFEGLLAS